MTSDPVLDYEVILGSPLLSPSTDQQQRHLPPQPPPDPRHGCCASLRLVSSGLGAATGLIVFVTFTFCYQNVEAGAWALASAAFSAIALHLFLLTRNYRLPAWHTPQSLLAIRLLTILGAMISLLATIYYIFTAISQEESMLPYSESHLLRGVWSMMTFKWTIVLVFFTKKCTKDLTQEYLRI